MGPRGIPAALGPVVLPTVQGGQSAFTGKQNYLLPQVGKIIITKKVPSTRS